MLNTPKVALSQKTIHQDPRESIVISHIGNTELSRYVDNIWDLSPYIQRKNSALTAIKFDTKFQDGSSLTDSKHNILRGSAKAFLYARWKNKAPHSRKYISAQTLLNNWAQLRCLLHWMVDFQISNFGELTPEKCVAYAKSLGERQSRSTIVINLQIITTYYDLRDHLDDQLPGYPWGKTPPSKLATSRDRNGKSPTLEATTEVIPNSIIRTLIQSALNLIEHEASTLLDLQEEFYLDEIDNRKRIESAHLAKHPSGFSSVYTTDQEYIETKLSHVLSKHRNKRCIEHGISSYIEFKNKLILLRTACYIVCATFSGMRASELSSLEVGCFYREAGFDDETFSWLKGKSYKLEKDPKPAKWMVPEVVGHAVDVATRLGARGRAACKENILRMETILAKTNVQDKSYKSLISNLTKAKIHQHALMFTERKNGIIYSLGKSSCLISLVNFATHFGAYVKQEDMNGIQDREKIAPGKIWPLSPHQFRRTFAVFVARNIMGDVRYLREHFKHWSIDMTLYYTKINSNIDSSVINEIVHERDELQSVLLEKWIYTNSPLSGGGGQRIAHFRGRSEVKVVKDMRAFCRKLGDDVYIRGTGHSWCMASGTGCGGQGLYDAVRCTSCGEGVIDGSQILIWRGIRDQQIETLQHPDIGASSWQRCVTHLREAERVLTELGEVIESYPVPNFGQSEITYKNEHEN
jgi:integrase